MLNPQPSPRVLSHSHPGDVHEPHIGGIQCVSLRSQTQRLGSSINHVLYQQSKIKCILKYMDYIHVLQSFGCSGINQTVALGFLSCQNANNNNLLLEQLIPSIQNSKPQLAKLNFCFYLFQKIRQNFFAICDQRKTEISFIIY